jgi:hypothetical protein
MIGPQMIDLQSSLRLFSFSAIPPLEAIKQKYRNLIKRYHPDLHPDKSELSNEMIRRLNQAYEILKANARRSQNESLPSSLVGRAIKTGDEAVKNAVIMGCLIRMRKNQLGRYFCGQVRKVRDILEAQADDLLWDIPFFYKLFSLFLSITEGNTPRPLPTTWNSTRFFKNLAIANRYLDTGVRHFYYYTNHNRLRFFTKIPLSFLRDAEKSYGYLRSYILEEPYLKLIGGRLELSRIYQQRISGGQLLSI